MPSCQTHVKDTIILHTAQPRFASRQSPHMCHALLGDAAAGRLQVARAEAHQQRPRRQEPARARAYAAHVQAQRKEQEPKHKGPWAGVNFYGIAKFLSHILSFVCHATAWHGMSFTAHGMRYTGSS